MHRRALSHGVADDCRSRPFFLQVPVAHAIIGPAVPRKGFAAGTKWHVRHLPRQSKGETLMRLSIAVFLVALCAAQAQGALVIYSGWDVANSGDPRPNADAAAAAFDLAASGLGPVATINFESASTGPFSNYLVAPGVTMDGLDINSLPQEVHNFAIGPPDGLFGYNTTVSGTQFVYMSAGDLTFTFATPVQSFGAYISGLQLAFNSLNFFDGANQTIPLPLPSNTLGGVAFVGFTDVGQSITSVTISTIGDLIGVDDVRFGVAPEPSSLVLATLGLIALGMCRMRKDRRSTH
jgi:hypothetical protein